MRGQISIFVASLRGGGAQRVAVRISGGLAEKGWDVSLLCASASGSWVKELSPRVEVHDFGVGSTKGSIVPLSIYLRRRRPPILLSITDNANFASLLARALSLGSTRIVVSVHSTISEVATNLSHTKDRFRPRLAKVLYPHADKIVAVSRGVADDVSAVTGLSLDKIEVIYNPVVSPDIFHKASRPNDHPWFEEGSPPVVLSVGGLVDAKDHDTLIKAMARIIPQFECRLIILGEGPNRRRLETLIKDLCLEDHIQLPGFEPNPYKFMSRCRLFVLASRWEGFGIVLVEALALGAGLVATDCRSGPREILRNGLYGSLVPVGDKEGLAKAIRHGLVQPLPKRSSGAWQQFTLERSITAYDRLLSDVLTESP